MDRMARRRRNADAPTKTTERIFLRAMRENVFSTRENQDEPTRGSAKAKANTVIVKQPSMKRSEGPVSGL